MFVVRGYGSGVGQTGDVCGAWMYVKVQLLGFVEVGLYAKYVAEPCNDYCIPTTICLTTLKNQN